MGDTLVIYDHAGIVYGVMSGYKDVPYGLSGLITTVPDGMYVVSVDTSVTPHAPVFAESQEAVLKDTLDAMGDAIAELAEIIGG